MKNITVATKENIGYYSLLVESCKKNNIELIVLGLGEKWTGFTMRFKLWLQYLNTLDDNEVVMINDAYDVIIIENKEQILEKFKTFKKPVVFGNQCGIYEYFIKRQEYTLCFGNMIGYVKYIKIIINILMDNKELWKKYNNDDQLILNELYAKHNALQDIIGIDKDNTIFFVASDLNRITNIQYLLNKDINGLKMENNLLLNQDNEPISILHLAANMDGNKYLNYIGYDTSGIKLTFEYYRLDQMYGIYFKNSVFLKVIVMVIIVLMLIYIIKNILKKKK